MKPENLAVVRSDAQDRVAEALAEIDRDQNEYLRFPWAALDEMVGGIGPGQVWFDVAFSGQGKTSFLMSALDAWYEEGKRIYYMGLESRPWELSIHWAARREGIHPGLAFSGQLRGTKQGELLRAALYEQAGGEMAERVYFDPVKAITLDGFDAAAHQAAEFEADVMIVDHIDHVGGSSRGYKASVAVVDRTLELAQDLNLRILAASQLNNDAVRGDALAMYQPPRPNMVYMGPNKRMVAHGMLGHYRPLRLNVPQAEAKEFAKMVKAVRAGHLKPREVLEPNTMGVVLMKHRLFGEREGDRAFLHIERGLVSDRLVLPYR